MMQDNYLGYFFYKKRNVGHFNEQVTSIANSLKNGHLVSIMSLPTNMKYIDRVMYFLYTNYNIKPIVTECFRKQEPKHRLNKDNCGYYIENIPQPDIFCGWNLKL